MARPAGELKKAAVPSPTGVSHVRLKESSTCRQGLFAGAGAGPSGRFGRGDTEPTTGALEQEGGLRAGGGRGDGDEEIIGGFSRAPRPAAQSGPAPAWSLVGDVAGCRGGRSCRAARAEHNYLTRKINSARVLF